MKRKLFLISMLILFAVLIINPSSNVESKQKDSQSFSEANQNYISDQKHITLNFLKIIGISPTSKQTFGRKRSRIISIGDSYNYFVGFFIPERIKSKNMSINIKESIVRLSSNKKAIEINISNDGPYMFGTAIFSGKIIELESNSTIFKKEIKNINIAPYSIFPFQLSLNKDLNFGKYMCKVTVSTPQRNYYMEKIFTIQ